MTYKKTDIKYLIGSIIVLLIILILFVVGGLLTSLDMLAVIIVLLIALWFLWNLQLFPRVENPDIVSNRAYFGQVLHTVWSFFGISLSVLSIMASLFADVLADNPSILLSSNQNYYSQTEISFLDDYSKKYLTEEQEVKFLFVLDNTYSTYLTDKKYKPLIKEYNSYLQQSLKKDRIQYSEESKHFKNNLLLYLMNEVFKGYQKKEGDKASHKYSVAVIGKEDNKDQLIISYNESSPSLDVWKTVSSLGDQSADGLIAFSEKIKSLGKDAAIGKTTDFHDVFEQINEQYYQRASKDNGIIVLTIISDFYTDKKTLLPQLSRELKRFCRKDNGVRINLLQLPPWKDKDDKHNSYDPDIFIDLVKEHINRENLEIVDVLDLCSNYSCHSDLEKPTTFELKIKELLAPNVFLYKNAINLYFDSRTMDRSFAQLKLKNDLDERWIGVHIKEAYFYPEWNKSSKFTIQIESESKEYRLMNGSTRFEELAPFNRLSIGYTNYYNNTSPPSVNLCIYKDGDLFDYMIPLTFKKGLYHPIIVLFRLLILQSIVLLVIGLVARKYRVYQ